MAASIKIEFDQESYEEAKKKLAELSEMASLVGENFKSAQHRVQWTLRPRRCLRVKINRAQRQ